MSTSAAILIAASWCQVPYGSDQPSTRYDQRPVVGALTVTVQKSRPGLMQVIGRIGGGAGRVGEHHVRVHRVVALPVHGGGDVEFLAHHRLRRPVAAVHDREDVGDRDPAERPGAGRRRNGLRRVRQLLGGRSAGRRALGGRRLVAAGAFVLCLGVFGVASVTPGTLPKPRQSASRRVSPAGRPVPPDQLVGRAVVLQVRVVGRLQLRDHPLAPAACPARRPTGRTIRWTRSRPG